MHENSVQVITKILAGDVTRPSRLWLRTESSTNSLHHLHYVLGFQSCRNCMICISIGPTGWLDAVQRTALLVMQDNQYRPWLYLVFVIVLNNTSCLNISYQQARSPNTQYSNPAGQDSLQHPTTSEALYHTRSANTAL